MKHYLSIVFLFLLLLVACDPAAELGTPFHKGQEVVLTAAIGEQRPQMMPSMQRISGKDAPTTIDLLWDEGDEIRVHVGEASSVFRLVAGAGTNQASFIGTMPASGSSYEVTYPKENNDDWLLQQTYVPDGIAKGLMKMCTTSPGTIDKGFTLSAEHAVLGLQLTGNREIGKIVLLKNDADGQAASPSYTLLCPKVTLTETATLFYIVLSTGIWEKGFTVKVYGADNTTIIDTFVTNKRFEFTAANATTMAEKDVQNPPKRIGVFSVAADKQVSFSQGNLQYTQKTNTWQFAEHQYDFIGEDNLNGSQLANRIDLFGWSGNSGKAPFGISTSTNAADYAGDFVDWGVNTISGDAPDTWRTLSIAEWEYLLEKRPNAANLQGIAQVNGVNGLIILPDDWVCPLGINFVHGFHSDFGIDYFAQHQQFTLDQWIILEQSGAVFLPASKWRNGSTFTNSSEGGHYWSSTCGEISTNAHYLSFGSQEAWMNSNSLHRCFAVRLVHDTIVPMPEPEYVDLGLSVKWATFNVGATSPEDYGDYFAWGETQPKEEYSWATYKWCEGTDKTMTKYCTNSQYGANGFTDGKTILEPEDDAAHVHWGGKWRMPSDEEMTELREKCTWTWTSINGVDGYEVTGPSGNSIFLPAAGFYFVDGYKSYGNGDYWSTKATNTDGAYHLYFNSDHHSRSSSFRYFGFPIRAVYDDSPKSDSCLVVRVNDTLSINMMCVKGGTFMMGDATTTNASPAHQVTLSDYYIGQTEVTQALWEAVMGSNSNQNDSQNPIQRVRYSLILEFISKLNQLTGMRFRLPTEAEWEYAAMGGQKSRGYVYAGSDVIDSVAWYGGNSGDQIPIVATKQPNELGIYDMSGSVWEWCADWYGEYSSEAQENPSGPDSGTGRVIRGGSYFVDPAIRCTVKFRLPREENYPELHIGFRLVHAVYP